VIKAQVPPLKTEGTEERRNHHGLIFVDLVI